MIFRSELRDAIWVNWAIPRSRMPDLPRPLVPDLLGAGETEAGFLSLVLFQQTGLRLAGLPYPRFRLPQANLRLLVRDGERVASVFFLRELMPAWAVPLARLLARQPASAAIFQIEAEPGGIQRWAFSAGAPLALVATPGAGAPASPGAASWPALVSFFRERTRGYLQTPRGLRRLEAEHPGAQAVPMRIEVLEAAWLRARLPEVDPETWWTPHSAFSIPSIHLSVAVASSLDRGGQEPLPAPGRPVVT